MRKNGSREVVISCPTRSSIAKHTSRHSSSSSKRRPLALLRYNKSRFVDFTHVQQNLESMNKAVEFSEDDLKSKFQAFDKEEWINVFFLERGGMKENEARAVTQYFIWHA
jgi:hypothetical protein